MTVAIVALTIALAGSLGLVAYLARSRSLLFDDLEAMAEDKLMHEARADDMEDQRDAALAERVRAEAETSAARQALITTQAAERAARQEKADALAAIARSASSDQLFELANRMLGSPLPGVTGQPAAGDRGDAGAVATVSAARPPGAAGADQGATGG